MEEHGRQPKSYPAAQQNDRVAISLPAATWREIESELRSRGVWWLANQLVNTGSKVFSEDQ